MICRALLMLGLFVFVLLSSSVGSPPASADPDQCPELVTDYSLQCSSTSTRCGSFCFYADCLDCENASHRDHGTHCHDDDDDDDDGGGSDDDDDDSRIFRTYNVSLGWSPRRGSDCHQDHGSHSYEISPCIDWFWHLYDPVHDRDSRSDDYGIPNLAESLEFGLVPDDYVPPEHPCETDLGAEEFFPGGLSPLAPLDDYGAGPHPAHSMAGVSGHPTEVTVNDLSHLPSTPGEPEAPTLSSITKVTDRSVLLGVVGGLPGTVQYRWWSYDGVRVLVDDDRVDWDGHAGESGPVELFPLNLKVPFEDLSGAVVIDDVRGIISFQARTVDAEGVPSGRSNIEHEMIGMAGFHTIGPQRTVLDFDLPVPPPPAWGTPQAPPSDPTLVRPDRPSAPGVEQVAGVEATVEVTLGGSYVGAVEYRWWPHSGFDAWDGLDLWAPAGVNSGSFLVSGVEADTPVINGVPIPSFFNFQVRVVSADGIPSDPSDVVVLMVWGGDYTGW